MKTKPSPRVFIKRATTGLRPVTTRLLFILALSSVLFALSPPPCALSQVPQGFNYQAVAHSSTGAPISNTTIQIKEGIFSDTLKPVIVWEELHSTVRTNANGVFNLVIGTGTKQEGSVSTFNDIDWVKTPLYLKIQINYQGTWRYMGSAKLWSVPYSMIAGGLDGTVEKLEVVGKDVTSDEALFEVKRKDGELMFGVYNHGVRINMPLDTLSKTRKGGFVVGGFDNAKGVVQDYLVVNPDSIRAYIDTNQEKTRKGGFAVGSFNQEKGEIQEYLTVSSDSVRVYINETDTKTRKGGFAVGGFNDIKGLTNEYFNVSGKAQSDIVNGEPKVLWYPRKEAFMTGNVLVESADSVGTNSWASGYRSKAIGDYSQALGYEAIAREDYSTAIGYQAIANNTNSFAFGQWATALNTESYAFGRGAIAEGFRSFAFGSAGIDSAGQTTGVAYSKGNYSFAIGQGSQAIGTGAMTFGLADTAMGEYSLAMGYKTKATGYYSTSLGYRSSASGYASLAIGWSRAEGDYSVAIGGGKAGGKYSSASGFNVKADGVYSFASGCNSVAGETGAIAMGGGSQALGFYSTAIGYGGIAKKAYSVAIGGPYLKALSMNETVLGSWNSVVGYTPYAPDGWDDRDRLFVIGNGYELDIFNTRQSNAVVILKNGNFGIGTNVPITKLDINGGFLTRYGGTPPPLSGGNFFIGWNYSGGEGETDFFQHGEAGWRSGYRFYTENNSQARTLLARLEDTGDLHILGNYGSLSDERSKTNIQFLKDGLTKILNLKGICFNWKDTIVHDNKIHLGLVAQDVLKILPEVVEGGLKRNGEDELYSIQYDGIIPVMIEAMKEQQQQIESYKSRLQSLQQEVEKIKALLETNGGE